jgi:hypothetical protein
MSSRRDIDLDPHAALRTGLALTLSTGSLLRSRPANFDAELILEDRNDLSVDRYAIRGHDVELRAECCAGKHRKARASGAISVSWEVIWLLPTLTRTSDPASYRGNSL